MSLRIIGILIAIPIVAFAYYAISPLFHTIETNDPLPVSVEISTPSAGEITSAQIIDTPAHPASGTVRILDIDGTQYIRYENFKTINGPDIFVYLANDLDAKDFIDVGRVKSTEGDANYEVPGGVNARDYRYVMVWCKAFGVLFNYADLQGEE